MRTTSPQKLKHAKKNVVWDTSGVLLDNAQAEGPVDFSQWFPDAPNRPVEIEIGVGKGAFLMARAQYRPEINFVGIEYAKPYALFTADRIRRHGIENIKMLAIDAGPFFTSALPDESVFRVHIYYPDPWPKRRHKRRRLIQPTFLQNVRRVLKPGGQLLLVTDHRDYFEHMTRVITDAPGFARCEFPKLLNSDVHIVGTNFEQKYVEEGRNFFRAAMVKYQ